MPRPHSFLLAAWTALSLVIALPAMAEPWDGMASTLFSHIGPEKGLPYPVALAVTQDSDGFVWIGTPGGLARWDGYRMRVFRHDDADPSSLPESIIVTLMVDERGTLWVATASGLVARYDRAGERFVTYRDSGSGLGRLYAMVSDGTGGVWVAGRNGLAHLDATLAIWRHEPKIADRQAGSLLRDRDGGLWLGIAGRLLHRLAGKEDFAAIAIDAAAPIGITALYEDEAGAIWFGTGDGRIGKVDASGTAHLDASLPASGHPVTGIVEAEKGTLWIADFGAGIRVLQTATGAVRMLLHDATDPSSLADDSVTGLLVDRSGLIWASSLRGVDQNDPRNHQIATLRPNEPNGLSGRDVRSIMARADGTLWLGFKDEGLAQLDPISGRHAAFHPDHGAAGNELPGGTVQAIAEQEDGTLWTGWLNGLFRIDPKTGKSMRFAPLGRVSVVGLLLEEPVLWAGTSAGLARIDLGDGSVHMFRHDPADNTSLSDNSPWALLRDGAQRLWVGTQRGLDLLDPATDQFRRFLHDPEDAESLPNDVVGSLLEDRHGRLWVATADGIGILDPQRAGKPRFRHLGTEDGLPNALVTKLLADRSGTIWASTGDGIAAIDPDSLSVRALGPADGLGIRTYWSGSGASMPDGTLAFGGFGGMTVIRPELALRWAFHPPVVLTALRIGGHLAPATLPITIVPDDRSLQVEFAALDFSAPERNRYAYRLDGFDPDWIATDAAHRIAAYTNLAPGDYRLLVRGSNRDGAWSDAPLALPIRVLPAWYQTIWFRLVIALAALVALFGLVQARTAYLRLRQRELERQVAAQTVEIAASHARAVAGEEEARRAKDDAEAANRAKSRFLAVISHEIRTPLNGVLGMLQMLDPARLDPDQRRYLEITEQSGEMLRGLVESILDYGRLEAEDETLDIRSVDPHLLGRQAIDLFREQAAAKGVTLDLAAAPELPPYVRCDRTRLNRVLLNLLGNAVKFTTRGVIRLSIGFAPAERATGGMLQIVVADTGIGIAPDMQQAIFEDFVQADDSIARRFGGTGLGLAICRRIAQLMGGTLTVESSVGIGSLFRLAVPVEIGTGEAVADRPAADAPPRSILVVDDEAVNREVASGLLSRLGHRVTMAADSRAALAALATGSFDLVLMDLHMPGIDGIETMRRIRALPDTAANGITVLAMTADVSEDTRQRCAQAGMAGTLAKPLQLDILRRVIGGAGSDASGPVKPQAADPGSLLDASFLATNCAILGRAEMTRLTRLFHRDSGRMLAALETATSHGDHIAARSLAHRLRSAAGALGLLRLEAAAAAIERAVPPGSDDTRAAHAAELRTLRRASIAALARFARTGGTPRSGRDAATARTPSRA